ncbi:hypothetical protein MNBD_GAMMA07-1475 [hydrothermal vent metagenome]|uniref:Uncharacterized protein n=1 Tax=hydrothermal vent metagenome TaxID=652676 RepID=A0A3B0X3T8_9ZZZZ
MLSACQTMPSNDSRSLSFEVPKGAVFSLNQKMNIPQLYSHGVVQMGKEIADDDIDDYNINCRLDFKKLGPRIIEPEEFTVTRTEDGTDWVSNSGILRFYTEVYLSSNQGTDVIKLTCQEYGDQLDSHFTVAQMQKALGDFMSFRFVK